MWGPGDSFYLGLSGLPGSRFLFTSPHYCPYLLHLGLSWCKYLSTGYFHKSTLSHLHSVFSSDWISLILSFTGHVCCWTEVLELYQVNHLSPFHEGLVQFYLVLSIFLDFLPGFPHTTYTCPLPVLTMTGYMKWTRSFSLARALCFLTLWLSLLPGS